MNDKYHLFKGESMKAIFVTLIVAIIALSGCSHKEPKMKRIDSNGTKVIGEYADVNHPDFIKEQALHDAVRAKDMDQVRLLVSNKSDINYQDKYGYTPLHIAVRLNDYNISKYLVMNGADVNTMDQYGDTPLIDSTRDNYTEISKLLICNGAKRNVEDRYDRTPLHFSAKNKNKLISEMLLAKDLYPYCSNGKIEKVMEKPVIEEPAVKEPAMQEENKIQEVPLSQVPEFKGLYEALQEEFKDDFEPWNAELTKGDLLFVFKNPIALFQKGKGTLKPGFIDILSDFFPRYLKVLSKYKDNIQEVRIEGHTSSEYASAKTDDERYRLNKILSTKRALNTRNYVVKQALEDSNIDGAWVKKTFQPYGMADNKLILNSDGSENKEASRRVEFKIIRK
jgi:outer membrane protein OmpA-like peptidoglycan-associated protein